jgi:hypothetical protein
MVIIIINNKVRFDFKLKLKKKYNYSLIIDGNVPFSGGYGVPYGTDGFAAGSAGGYYQQQQQFPGGNYGFNNQYQGNAYDQGQFGGDQTGATAKHRRRHHRHHRHDAAEVVVGSDHAAGVPE